MKTYELIDIENPVFCAYIVWCSVLAIKMLLMSTLTSFHRFRTETFSNPEDAAMAKVQEVKFDNDKVERVRRAHRNDMENILPYLVIGLFYVLSSPPPTVAIICFITATVARILHTIVYTILVIPQPARGICFFVHWAITLYFAVAAIIKFI